MKLHTLKIAGGIFLDGRKVEGVLSYKVNHKKDSNVAKLTMTMDVILRQEKTCELLEELKAGEGVSVVQAEPYERKKVELEGPAVALIVID